jgi:putative hemolysin
MESPVSAVVGYRLRLARNHADVRAAQALRYDVFNVELNEGLAQSEASGLDADPFDEFCDHLLVEELKSGQVVGTYRMQTGLRAALHSGYYSEQEFDFYPFEPLRGELVELGRACVAPAHRNLVVLQMLWRGISRYARSMEARYLIGCSSINTTDPRVGAALYSRLMRTHLVPPLQRTNPWPTCACPLENLVDEARPVPKLLAAYLALGAQICGPPALDREFKTIDFLTLLDLETLSPRAAARYSIRPSADEAIAQTTA